MLLKRKSDFMMIIWTKKLSATSSTLEVKPLSSWCVWTRSWVNSHWLWLPPVNQCSERWVSACQIPAWGRGQRSLDLVLRGNAFSVDAAKTHRGGAHECVHAGEANFLPVERSPAAAAWGVGWGVGVLAWLGQRAGLRLFFFFFHTENEAKAADSNDQTRPCDCGLS